MFDCNLNNHTSSHFSVTIKIMEPKYDQLWEFYDSSYCKANHKNISKKERPRVDIVKCIFLDVDCTA